MICARSLSIFALGSCLLLTACGQFGRFQEPQLQRNAVAADQPYPSLAVLPSTPAPLLSAAQRANATGALTAQNTSARANIGGLNARQASVPGIQAPARRADNLQIQNIPASGNPQQLQQQNAAAGQAVTNRAAGVQSRQQRIQALSAATRQAIRGEQQRAQQAQSRQQQILAQRRQQALAQQQAAQQQQARAQAARAEMRRRLTDIPEPKTNADLFALKDAEPIAIIYFEKGTTDVKESDREVLFEAARLLKEEGGKLKIVGHSSPPADGIVTKENREANIKVSRVRTESVAKALLQIGVPLQLLELTAMADTQPVFSINSARGQSGNRRVEIYRVAADAKPADQKDG